VLGVWLCVVFVAQARAADTPVSSTDTTFAARAQALAAARAAHLRDLKSLEREILLGGEGDEAWERVRPRRTMRAKRDARTSERRPRERGTERAKEKSRRGEAAREPRERTEAGRPRGKRIRGVSPILSRSSSAFPNRLANDRTQDVTFGVVQSEMALGIAPGGMLMAWNDGNGLVTGTSLIGYATSTDGGATWQDGDAPPLGGGIGRWLSDPVIAVDEKRGDFYLAGLALVLPPQNAIAVVHGRFDNGQFVWDTPVVARGSRDTLPDKPWLAADSLSGVVYLGYTTFFGADTARSSQIEFQASRDRNLTWDLPRKISLPSDDGLVQGARPAVGPQGELRVVWRAVDTTLVRAGVDFLRMRSSFDQGETFGPQSDAASFFPNFGSGAPGFNRGFGQDLPGLAIDRSFGPHRGRVYVSWNEGLNVFADLFGSVSGPVDAETGNGPAFATPFEVGQTLRGTIGDGNDVDAFSFDGQAGQTIVVYADSLARDLDVSLRLLCQDGHTQLAYSAPLRVRRRFISFTLPETGRYYLTLASLAATIGNYRIRTSWHQPGGERSRDHRDVFVAHSDDGVTWSEPVRVNDDPPGYDNWLPEVAVATDGSAYVCWYDFHDAPIGTCGGVSHTYLSRSLDGGENWTSFGPVSSAQTIWSSVTSNLEPNQGDYIALATGPLGVYPVWSDGRNGDPDAFTSLVPLDATPTLASLVSAAAAPDCVHLVWRVSDETARVTIERRTEDTPWASFQPATIGSQGEVRLDDGTVSAGTRYGYRLALDLPGGVTHAGEAWVDVPRTSPLALAILPSTPSTSAMGLVVRVTLPNASPATIDLLDPSGRRLASQELTVRSPGQQTIRLAEAGELRSGLYLVRVRQAGASASAKAAVLR
jgi:hypothetical protein